MRHRFTPVVMLAIAAAIVSAAPLVGQVGGAAKGGDVIEKISVAELAAMMKAEGYAAEASADGSDIVWKIEGAKTRIFVSEDGSSIQFYVGFTSKDVTLEKVNAWNQTKKYSKSYLDKAGDPCLELDLDFDGGITRDRVLDFAKTARVSFETWRTTVLK